MSDDEKKIDQSGKHMGSQTAPFKPQLQKLKQEGLVLQPVLVLGGAQHVRTYFGILTQNDTFLPKAPATINNLRPRFHLQGFLAVGQLVRYYLGVKGANYFHAMANPIMENIRKSQTIALGGTCVQDYFLSLS